MRLYMKVMCSYVCLIVLILSLAAISLTTAEDALWLVQYNNDDKKFELNENALSKLSLLSTPVKVISAIGEARVGKSTTLNFIHHLWKCNGKQQTEIEQVFQTGNTMEPVTYGIWISICENNNENIVLLDVEGTNLGNDAITSHMSVFTSLISSGIVVFSAETIKNDILDFLYEVTRLGDHIFKGIDEANNFGHLHVVIRGALSASHGTAFEDEVKNSIVKPSGNVEATNNKRRSIAKYFHEENIKVCKIPLIMNTELLKDIQIKNNVEYWDAMTMLAESFKNFPSKRTLRQNPVDGKALVKIANTLIEMMNKKSWMDFSDNYLMVEKYLCDKTFEEVITPALELESAQEIENRKKSALKTFTEGCALAEEISKVDADLNNLIKRLGDIEKKEMQLKLAQLEKERAEMLINEIKSRYEEEKRISHNDHYLKGFLTHGAAGIAGALLLGLVFSDARLKENVITLTPSKYESLGVREVTWTWNKHAEKIGLRGKDRGVIAQEVEKLYPWAVVTGDDGYKRVLYAALDSAIALLDTINTEMKYMNFSANAF